MKGQVYTNLVKLAHRLVCHVVTYPLLYLFSISNTEMNPVKILIACGNPAEVILSLRFKARFIV